jgi:hypothetical protein
MMMKKLNSEQLAKYYRRLKRLKEAVNLSGYPIPVMVEHCLLIVETYYGKAEIAKKLLDEHRRSKGRWTAEEIAEMEKTEREIAEMERDELEDLRRDYTPPDFTQKYWADFKNLAMYLIDQSELGEAEFDQAFNDILVHRYRQRVVIDDNGKELTVYYRKSERDVLLAEIVGE